MSLFSFIQVCAACLRLSNCLFLGLGTDHSRRPLKQTEFHAVYPVFWHHDTLCLKISWMCFGFCIFLYVLLPEFSMNEYSMLFYLSCCCFFESEDICEWIYDLNYHWSRSVDIPLIWISVIVWSFRKLFLLINYWMCVSIA